ncbi:hypothetical protein Y032_0242g3444 [Ancylostoma ceylanicum]|nr:hypothetical protein Y032_0242g3444 [Ancylostoma ceylanicum]
MLNWRCGYEAVCKVSSPLGFIENSRALGILKRILYVRAKCDMGSKCHRLPAYIESKSEYRKHREKDDVKR